MYEFTPLVTSITGAKSELNGVRHEITGLLIENYGVDLAAKGLDASIKGAEFSKALNKTEDAAVHLNLSITRITQVVAVSVQMSSLHVYL